MKGQCSGSGPFFGPNPNATFPKPFGTGSNDTFLPEKKYL